MPVKCGAMVRERNPRAREVNESLTREPARWSKMAMPQPHRYALLFNSLASNPPGREATNVASLSPNLCRNGLPLQTKKTQFYTYPSPVSAKITLILHFAFSTTPRPQSQCWIRVASAAGYKLKKMSVYFADVCTPDIDVFLQH